MLRRIRQIYKAWLARKTLVKPAPRKRPKPRKRVDPKEVVVAATGAEQWLTVYADGRVRIHVRKMYCATDALGEYRQFEYRPKLKSDRAAIAQLARHFNRTAAGLEGQPCRVRNCYD